MPTMNSSMHGQTVGHRVEPSAGLMSSDIERVRAEYVEMPGLSVTSLQAARLWGLDTLRSEQVLSMLVDSGFLLCDRQGLYRRRR